MSKYMVDLFALVVAQRSINQHDHQQWIQSTIHYLQLKRNNRIFTGMATDSHILYLRNIFCFKRFTQLETLSETRPNLQLNIQYTLFRSSLFRMRGVDCALWNAS
jgi:hypothetical protein